MMVVINLSVTDSERIEPRKMYNWQGLKFIDNQLSENVSVMLRIVGLPKQGEKGIASVKEWGY